MEDDDTPRVLDALLERSAPPTFRHGPSVDALIVAVIDEARTASRRRRVLSRRPSRAVAIILAAALLGAGGAATAGILHGSGPWWWFPPGVEARNTVLEWQVVDPAGERCVYRLNAMDFSAADRAATLALLRDPKRLVAYDGGATRSQFLAEVDLPGVDLAAPIDLAYDRVATINIDAGRGGLSDEELDKGFSSVENELFFDAYTSILVNGFRVGLADRGGDPFDAGGPEMACEVAP